MEQINKSMGMVKEFMTLFDQPILEIPQIPSEDRVKLRINLILEELRELAQASGNLEKFSFILEDELDKVNSQIFKPDFKEESNVIEALDAFGDLQYVLDGAILEYGMGEAFSSAFEEIHRSNMTKACSDMNEVQQTMSNTKENCFYVKKGDKYLVYRYEDKKLIKSCNYSKAVIELT